MSWMRTTRRAALTILVLALAAGACAKKAAISPVTSTTVDPAFYATPDPMPAGRPGDILRSQVVQRTAAGTTWRVLYRSESLGGAPIAVSGMVVVPPGRPPAGGWPVLSLAHGTVGLADSCAPSRASVTPAALDVPKGNFVVVATDYEGLGTAGRHPFLVGESEARGVIDAVRAARAMGSAVQASDRYVIVGYSQGGHAALFANQIAATWAPELHLVGVVAGAPVMELGRWLNGLAPRSYGWLDALVVAGLGTVDPAARPDLVLSPAAVAKLGVVDEECLTQLPDAFLHVNGVLTRDPATVPPFDRLIAANTPGQLKGTAPLLILTGGADEVIPASITDAGIRRVCATGQVLARRTYPGVDHGGIITASFRDALQWLQARLAREPISPSGCQ